MIDGYRRQGTSASEVGPRVLWAHPSAVAVVALVICFIRMPDRFMHGFLWAEDGNFYLAQAYSLGSRSIFASYAGYLVLTPRLIALAYSKVAAIDQAPRPLVWISAFLVCATCAYLFSVARRAVSPAAAWLFALTPLLVPHRGEVWLTITNLQCVFAPVLFVLLWVEFWSPADDSANRLRDYIPSAVIFIMTLTGPFGVLFAPVAVFGLMRRRNTPRSRRTWVAASTYFLAALLQLATMAAKAHPQISAEATRPSYAHFPWAAQLVHYLALDLVMPTAWTAHLGAALWLATLLAGLVEAACLLLAGRESRALCLGLAGLAIGLWMLGVIRTNTPQTDLRWDLFGDRYFYAPFTFLTWAFLIAMVTTRYPIIRFTAGGLLVLVLVSSLSQFRARTFPAPSVAWHEETRTWQLLIPPSPDWSVDLAPHRFGMTTMPPLVTASESCAGILDREGPSDTPGLSEAFGWVYDTARRTIPATVVVADEVGHTLGSAAVGLARPDAANAMHTRNPDLGWLVRYRSTTSPLHFLAKLDDGRYCRIGS